MDFEHFNCKWRESDETSSYNLIHIICPAMNIAGTYWAINQFRFDNYWLLFVQF